MPDGCRAAYRRARAAWIRSARPAPDRGCDAGGTGAFAGCGEAGRICRKADGLWKLSTRARSRCSQVRNRRRRERRLRRRCTGRYPARPKLRPWPREATTDREAERYERACSHSDEAGCRAPAEARRLCLLEDHKESVRVGDPEAQEANAKAAKRKSFSATQPGADLKLRRQSCMKDCARRASRWMRRLAHFSNRASAMISARCVFTATQKQTNRRMLSAQTHIPWAMTIVFANRPTGFARDSAGLPADCTRIKPRVQQSGRIHAQLRRIASGRGGLAAYDRERRPGGEAVVSNRPPPVQFTVLCRRPTGPGPQRSPESSAGNHQPLSGSGDRSARQSPMAEF